MLDLILDYESDELDNDQIIELFQQIYDNKAYLWLQGHYYRTLDHLIDAGLIHTDWHKLMITSKAQMLRIMKKCDGADTLTREQKFQVFVNVCDNMLKQGRMTKATHKRFTHIFWSWKLHSAHWLNLRLLLVDSAML